MLNKWLALLTLLCRKVKLHGATNELQKVADHLLICANEASKDLLGSLEEAGNHVLCDPDIMAPLPNFPQSTGSLQVFSFFNKILPSALSGC